MAEQDNYLYVDIGIDGLLIKVDLNKIRTKRELYFKLMELKSKVQKAPDIRHEDISREEIIKHKDIDKPLDNNINDSMMFF